MSKPVVGIIMGSKSDLAVMAAAGEILDEFAIPFELTIVSAHRTPERMVDYAREAHTRGLKVIIAGAGGAAHLPGMVRFDYAVTRYRRTGQSIDFTGRMGFRLVNFCKCPPAYRWQPSV